MLNLTIFQYAKSNPRVGLKLDNAIMPVMPLLLSEFRQYALNNYITFVYVSPNPLPVPYTR